MPADLPHVATALAQIRQDLDQGRSVLVTGPPGSGRADLARAVAQQWPEASHFELPALTEPDAAASLYLAARSLVGEAPEREALSRVQPIVLLRLQGSSPAGWAPPAERWDPHQRRLHAALRLLNALPRAIWVADEAAYTEPLELRRLALPAQSRALHLGHWGALEPAAQRLAGAVGATVHVTPLWRIAVGATHLGADPATLAAHLRRPTAEAIGPLAAALARGLRPHKRLTAPIRALLLSRRPMPWARFLAQWPLDETDAALILHAITDGDPVRVHPFLRAPLALGLARPAPADMGATHAQLARFQATEDGASDPNTLHGLVLSAWAEKVHHLSLGGEEAREEWARQVKPHPELYWERARHLSIVGKRYEEAATVYEDCLRHFPDEAYAHHYLAYNLELAGLRPASQREHYAVAVDKDPLNPWWRSRLIGNLIRLQRWTEALQAWRQALDALTPDGIIDPELLEQFHLHVAKAWLMAGVWTEARAITESLSRQAGARSAHWRAVSRQIHDAAAGDRGTFAAYITAHHPDLQPLLQQIAARVSDLSPPAITEGEEGVCIAWSLPGIYLSLEPLPGDRLFWYGWDRLTDEKAGAEVSADLTDPTLALWLRRLRHG